MLTKIFFASQGRSMLPILQQDDLVEYQKISLNRCRINDLVMVKKKGQFFTHRVVYKAKKYLITKGDNNPQSDGKIYPKQIIGKVYRVKRKGQVFFPEQLYLVQSTHYFQEIVRIKDLFEREKIKYVFLKGPPLHLYFEGAHPQRIYADCDVLIDKKDFQKAEKILIKNGYRKLNVCLSKVHQRLKEKEIENAYYKVINGFLVVFDLHLEAVFMMTQLGKLDALYPQFLVDQLTEEFLKTKRKVKINNEEFLILHTYYLILYLALHLFHHNFRGAFRYQFLDAVIRRSLKSVIKNQKSVWEPENRKQISDFLSQYHPQFSNNGFLFSEIKPSLHQPVRLDNGLVEQVICFATFSTP